MAADTSIYTAADVLNMALQNDNRSIRTALDTMTNEQRAALRDAINLLRREADDTWRCPPCGARLKPGYGISTTENPTTFTRQRWHTRCLYGPNGGHH